MELVSQLLSSVKSLNILSEKNALIFLKNVSVLTLPTADVLNASKDGGPHHSESVSKSSVLPDKFHLPMDSSVSRFLTFVTDMTT